jgi:hypothetical protein
MPSNRRFGREARARFNVDQIQASRAMRVARLYAERAEIYRAVSWRTLVELASPKMSPPVRQALEAKVIAGERVSAPRIRRAREAHAQRRAGWPRSCARRPRLGRRAPPYTSENPPKAAPPPDPHWLWVRDLTGAVAAWAWSIRRQRLAEPNRGHFNFLA